MVFEWDAAKSLANVRKHGISFEEAATVFRDPAAWTFPDPDHSEDEHREITIGHTVGQRLIFVSHSEREDWHSHYQRTLRDKKRAASL